MGSSTAQYGINGNWVRSRKITIADTNKTVPILDVPAKTLIPPFGVVIVVTTLLDGGTPSIDIGDGTDADGWIDTLDITETTAGTYAGTETNSALATTGKYYAAADTIDAVVATGLTAGAAYVFAYMIPVDDIIDD
jgi:hypothetical protein